MTITGGRNVSMHKFQQLKEHVNVKMDTLSWTMNQAVRSSLLVTVHLDRSGNKVTVHVLKDIKRLMSNAYRNALDSSFMMIILTAHVTRDKQCWLAKSQDVKIRTLTTMKVITDVNR